MTTIKFDKAVKYRGVRYAAHEAFEVFEEDVEQLRSQGATVLSVSTPDQEEVESSEEPEEGDSEDEEEPDKESVEDVGMLREKLLNYTVTELTQFAQERGINLQGKTRKSDIYNVIVAALN